MRGDREAGRRREENGGGRDRLGIEGNLKEFEGNWREVVDGERMPGSIGDEG